MTELDSEYHNIVNNKINWTGQQGTTHVVQE